MRKTSYLIVWVLFLTFMHSLYAQPPEEPVHQRDSIYCDRGIPGTDSFEPDQRIIFAQRDEQGRSLETVFYQLDDNETWQFQSRRMFTYEGEFLTQMLIQAWRSDMQEWRDVREDNYIYEEGRLREFRRRLAQQGQLQNNRRWLYAYTPDGNDAGVVLQEWENNEWVDLSRKLIVFNENDEVQFQTLQIWNGSEWRNARRRGWTYIEDTGEPRTTIVQVWSPDNEMWVNNLRKDFTYDANGFWVGALYQTWDPNSEEWVDGQQESYDYTNPNQPMVLTIQESIGENMWENLLRNSVSQQNDQFIARLERWDADESVWNNFLRHRTRLNDLGLMDEKVGMQAWNAETEDWENQNFTRRYKHFWSEVLTETDEPGAPPRACTLPNPYPAGTYFHCDLPRFQQNYQLELFDPLGRLIHSQQIGKEEAVSINGRPVPGMYVLRVRSADRIWHVQRLIIQ